MLSDPLHSVETQTISLITINSAISALYRILVKTFCFVKKKKKSASKKIGAYACFETMSQQRSVTGIQGTQGTQDFVYRKGGCSLNFFSTLCGEYNNRSNH